VILILPSRSGGFHLQRDPLDDFFSPFLKDWHLVDLEPPKLIHTWRNGRKGADSFNKRMDQFLISEELIEGPWIIKSWVASGDLYDHLSILFKMDKKEPKPPSPLKFNPSCLVEDGYWNLITST
jgi:hypothetical protein